MVVVLAITLLVMASVFETAQHILRIYRSQSRAVERASSATRALDDIAREIYEAGYGLGEAIDRVQRLSPETGAVDEGIVLWSNPEGIATPLTSELTRATQAVHVGDAEPFRKGDRVLLVEMGAPAERALVTDVSGSTVSLRSLDAPDGELTQVYSPSRGARLLALHEVRYLHVAAPDAGSGILLKQVDGEEPRVLARGIGSLAFEYLDDQGEPMPSPARVWSPTGFKGLSSIRVRLGFEPDPDRAAASFLSTVITLPSASGDIDFQESSLGFRLSRLFHPVVSPAGLASRAGSDVAVILAAGEDPLRDRAYLLSFPVQPEFLGVKVEDVTWLDDVRGPIALVFGPEGGPLAGSLFLVASGLRKGHLARVFPDEAGGLSSRSRTSVLEGTEAIARAGGLAFGLDGALYVSGTETAGLYRYVFDARGDPEGPEPVARTPGSPGPMALGPEGALYYFLRRTDETALWKLPFDEALSPEEPARVTSLPGRGLALTADPLTGGLFALVREDGGDTVLLELSRSWLRQNGALPPREVFRLSRFKDDLEEGRLPPASSRLPPELVPDTLDFAAFDAWGGLYLGASSRDLVLKFELSRPEAGLYAVGLSGVVLEDGVRLHAWKKTRLGL